MEVDYIIAGQGIAGTMLARELEKAGCSFIVADPEYHHTPSFTAPGIMNPLIGIGLSKTWNADTLFPYARESYREIENLLGISFFQDLPIYKIAGSPKILKKWQKKLDKPELQPFIQSKEVPEENYFNNPHGGLTIAQSGKVSIKRLVLGYRNHLKELGRFYPEKVEENDLEYSSSHVNWQGIRAKKLIVSNGAFKGLFRDFFNSALEPSKGQVLVFKADAPEKAILNKGAHIAPMGNGFFWGGSTNEGDVTDLYPTQNGRETLREKINDILKVPWEIQGQLSGVRPVGFDKKPVIGPHPSYPRIAIFNGMGSKGTVYSPWLARVFKEHLLHGESIPEEVSTERLEKAEQQVNSTT